MEVCLWCIKEGLVLREIDVVKEGFLDTSLNSYSCLRNNMC